VENQAAAAPEGQRAFPGETIDSASAIISIAKWGSPWMTPRPEEPRGPA
jgi:hypothetical protein